MAKKSSLGIGLNELLSNIKTSETSDHPHKTALKHLAIELLKPGRYQPRGNMDKEALAELAASIQTQGIIQPIIVRPLREGKYEIIAGERRWRAAQLANLHEVPVVIRELQDQQAIALALIENIQREDLNAIDTALSLQRLINEFKLTHENAASAIGKSRTVVTNLLRLLSLADEVKNMVQQGALEMGHARALLALTVAQQLAAAKTIIAKKLSVRASEALVKKLQQPPSRTTPSLDPNTTALQRQLATTLAATVKIHHTKTGKGKIIINYNTLDELEGILQHIK